MSRADAKKILKHISRVEQVKKRQYGWLVRIMRDGVTHQKFFSDGGSISKSGSLLKAIAFRDELLRKYPKPPHGNMFGRLSSRNTSEYPGVHKTTQTKRGVAYEVWAAGWTLPNGKRVTKKFHFSPDGRSDEEAKQLAIRAREEGLKEIERMRRGVKRKKGAKEAISKKATASTKTLPPTSDRKAAAKNRD